MRIIIIIIILVEFDSGFFLLSVLALFIHMAIELLVSISVFNANEFAGIEGRKGSIQIFDINYANECEVR